MQAVVEFTTQLLGNTESQPLLESLKKQRDMLSKKQAPNPLLIGAKRKSERFKFTAKRDTEGGSSSSSLTITSDDELLKETPSPADMKQEILNMLKQILCLFYFATFRDKCILALGSLAAVVHGASFPFLALIFGNMSNKFLMQSTPNSTDLHNTSTTHALITPNLPFALQNSTDFNMTGVTNLTGNKVADELIGDLSASFKNFFVSPEGGPPITKEEFSEYVSSFALNYVYIGLVVFASSFLQTACWEWAAENQMYRLKQGFTYQMIRQEMKWFDKNTAGTLVLKLADDCERVREGLGHKFSMIIELVAIFCFGALFGLLTNWKLALTFMASTPFTVFKILLLWKSIGKQSKHQQEAYGKAGAISAEVLQGIRTVAAFGGELKERQRYNHALNKAHMAAYKKYFIVGGGTGVGYLFIYGFYAVAFWYGVTLLMSKSISPGEIYTVFFGVTISTFALGSMLPFVSSIATAFGSAQVIRSVMVSEPSIDPYSDKGVIPKRLYGKIKFADVTFKYPSREHDSPIFTDLNFNIWCGQKVAIVGPSGSGKTTLINLLLRFYDPQSGTIRLDNQELKSLNVPWLRNQFSLVPQHSVFFLGSIFDNLRCGNWDLKLQDVIKISKLTQAHDSISALPQGYSTIIGITGKQLSSGQRQRLAITRAIIQNRAILILDEATSAIDKETAAKIEGNIDKARKGKTTIVIAHRLHGVQNSDWILVLKAGKIVESGTHNGLIKAQGTYYTMIMQEELIDHVPGTAEEDSPAAVSSDDASDLEREKVAALAMDKRFRRKSKRAIKTTKAQVDEWLQQDKEKSQKYLEPIEYPSLRKQFRLISDEWHILLLGYFGCIVSGLVIPMLALYLGNIFVTFTLTGDALYSSGLFWTGMLVVLAVAAGFGYFLRIMCINCTGEQFTLRLRMEAYVSILCQPISWFDNEENSPARLYTRLASDVPFVKTAVGSRLGAAISSVVCMFAATVISFVYGWQLACLTLIAVPILLIAAYFQIRQHKVGHQKLAVMMEDVVRLLTRTVQEIWSVQAFSRALDVCEQFEDYILPALFEGHKQALIYGLAFAFSESVVFLIFGAAFRLGAELIRLDEMQPVALFTVFFALAFASLTLGNATSYIPEYWKAKLSASFIFKLIDLKSPCDPLAEDGISPDIRGKITFKDVHFSYPTRSTHKVLQGVSFEVPEGGTLGIVGVTGVGKSSILALLERFYEMDSGQILIDGIDIRDMNLRHLRANIAYVPQEPIMFDMSIRANIAYGLVDNIGDEDEVQRLVEEAADAANADDFILELGQGFDSVCGERGGLLTGGQKQRIAIARAFIRNANILLLDDPTSAVDVEEEKVILGALKRVREGRTTIIVSNRASIIQDADRIAVLAKGKVAEYGTHEELMTLEGIYSTFVQQDKVKKASVVNPNPNEEEEEECLSDMEG